MNHARPFAARVAASDLTAAHRMVSLTILSLDSALQIPVRTANGVRRMWLDSFSIDGPFMKVEESATLCTVTTLNIITLFDPGGEGTLFTSRGDFTDIRTSIGRIS